MGVCVCVCVWGGGVMCACVYNSYGGRELWRFRYVLSSELFKSEKASKYIIISIYLCMIIGLNLQECSLDLKRYSWGDWSTPASDSGTWRYNFHKVLLSVNLLMYILLSGLIFQIPSTCTSLPRSVGFQRLFPKHASTFIYSLNWACRNSSGLQCMVYIPE